MTKIAILTVKANNNYIFIFVLSDYPLKCHIFAKYFRHLRFQTEYWFLTNVILWKVFPECFWNLLWAEKRWLSKDIFFFFYPKKARKSDYHGLASLRIWEFCNFINVLNTNFTGANAVRIVVRYINFAKSESYVGLLFYNLRLIY